MSERIEEIRASYNCVNTFENEAGKREFTTEELKKVVSSQKNINDSIPYLLKELEEAQQKLAYVKESKRLLHKIHDEQCARTSEYYNELLEAQQTIAKITAERDKLSIAIGAALTNIEYAESGDEEDRAEAILRKALGE